MKYKMLALDLGGTVLLDGKISDRVHKAIHVAINKGVRVAFVTGRPYNRVKAVYEMIGFHDKTDQLHISNNGSVIATPQGKIFSVSKLDKESYLTLVERLEASGLHYTVSTALKNYTNKRTTLFDYEEGVVDKIDDLKSLADEATGVVVVASDLATAKQMVEGLDFSCVNSYMSLYDICPINLDKGVGLQQLANYYNIDIKEVMAIGDSDNDLGMLKVAGFSLAMGQGSEMAKALAKGIAPSVEEDGVAWAIEKYIL